MAESLHGVSTLARLSFWVPAERLDDFEEVYERQLVPLLEEHGLVSSVPDERPAVEGIFRRLFEVEHATGIVAKRRTLAKDAAWQAALCGLKPHLTPTASEEHLPYQFEL